MSELTEFLLARVAEDEQRARDNGADAMMGARWRHAPENVYQELQRTVLEHSRHVLRECEAKRRIVERCSKYDPSWHSDMELADVAEVMEDTLYDIAAIYADHPDFDPTWT